MYDVGLGMHMPVADASDWVARFSINHNKAVTDFTDSAHTGYDLGTGFNVAVATGLELSTFLDHTTASTDATNSLFNNSAVDSSPETILSAGLHTQVGKNLDFGVTEEYSNLGQGRLLLSMRWDF